MLPSLYQAGFNALKTMMERNYSEPTINIAMGLCGIAPNRLIVMDEMWEFLQDESHNERDLWKWVQKRLREVIP